MAQPLSLSWDPGSTPAIIAMVHLQDPILTTDGVEIIQRALSAITSSKSESEGDPNQYQPTITRIVHGIILIAERHLAWEVQDYELQPEIRFRDFEKLLGLYPGSRNYFIPEDQIIGYLVRLYERTPAALNKHLMQICMICFGEKNIFEIVDAYCKDCIEWKYRVSMNEGEYHRLQRDLPLDRVRCFLEEETLEKVKEKQKELLTDPTIRLYCSQKQCLAFIGPLDLDNNPPFFVCGKCGQSTCTKCKRSAHPGLEICPEPERRELEDQEAFENVCKNNGYKKCPACHIATEKTEGCSHMQCTICQTPFCWECGNIAAGCVCPEDNMADDPFYLGAPPPLRYLPINPAFNGNNNGQAPRNNGNIPRIRRAEGARFYIPPNLFARFVNRNPVAQYLLDRPDEDAVLHDMFEGGGIGTPFLNHERTPTAEGSASQDLNLHDEEESQSEVGEAQNLSGNTKDTESEEGEGETQADQTPTSDNSTQTSEHIIDTTTNNDASTINQYMNFIRFAASSKTEITPETSGSVNEESTSAPKTSNTSTTSTSPVLQNTQQTTKNNSTTSTSSLSHITQPINTSELHVAMDKSVEATTSTASNEVAEPISEFAADFYAAPTEATLKQREKSWTDVPSKLAKSTPLKKEWKEKEGKAVGSGAGGTFAALVNFGEELESDEEKMVEVKKKKKKSGAARRKNRKVKKGGEGLVDHGTPTTTPTNPQPPTPTPEPLPAAIIILLFLSIIIIILAIKILFF